MEADAVAMTRTTDEATTMTGEEATTMTGEEATTMTGEDAVAMIKTEDGDLDERGCSNSVEGEGMKWRVNTHTRHVSINQQLSFFFSLVYFSLVQEHMTDLDNPRRVFLNFE